MWLTPPTQRLAEERLETERTELQDQVMQLSDKLRETSAAMATIQAEREEVCAMLQPPTHGELSWQQQQTRPSDIPQAVMMMLLGD